MAAYRARRRVYAADGSAFLNCSRCGRSVPVALYGMHNHECLLVFAKRSRAPDRVLGTHRKRPKGDDGLPSSPVLISDSVDGSPDEVAVVEPAFRDGEVTQVGVHEKPSPSRGSGPGLDAVDLKRLPRSAFRFFMESYEEDSRLQDRFEIDRTGFDKWRTMTTEERKPYRDMAEQVDLAYIEGLASGERRQLMDYGEGESSYDSVNFAMDSNNPYRIKKWLGPARCRKN